MQSNESCATDAPAAPPAPPGDAGRLQHWQRSAGQLLRHAAGMVRELRAHDDLVLGECHGELVGKGGPLRLHYFGRRRFAHDFLTFFERPAQPEPAAENAPAVQQSFRERAGVLSFLVSRTGLQRCPPDADLLVVDQYLQPGALARPAVTHAPFLQAILRIEADLEAQLLRVRSKGHRRKLQSCLKEAFVWRKTQALSDFDRWYTTMYQPFVRLRFGDDATVVPREEMLDIFTKRGFLLLLEENGEPVSGALLYHSRSMPGCLNYWKYAMRDAAELAPAAFGERNARTEAMVLQHTVAAGYRELNFGLTRGCPTDGIFIHKKRVGCEFIVPQGAAQFAMLFAPGQQARLLGRYPLVVQTAAGMEVWMGQSGELDFYASRRLRDTLSACSFEGLKKVHLFVTGVDASAEKLQGIAAAGAAELGCEVQLVSP